MSKKDFGHCCTHMSPYNHACGTSSRHCKDSLPCVVRAEELGQLEEVKQARKKHGELSNKWKQEETSV